MRCNRRSGKIVSFAENKRCLTYTAMISGYGANRKVDAAFATFDELRAAAILLAACAHTGAVDRARQIITQLRSGTAGMAFTSKHENSYLDVLSRSGEL